MDRHETTERKLSKRRSNSATSFWSRKSSKRTPNSQPAPSKDIPPEPSSPIDSNINDTHDTRLMSGPEGTQTMPSRSVIPDIMNGRPSWYNSDIWSTVPMPSFRVRYPIHNPHGPRWYRNHHLIPPSQVKPSVRPPSFFSPSFPPISTTSIPEPVDDLSRTPSHSPLPTPNSSQTGVADTNPKARSRKTSQTSPDNVDLMDVTDPWGTNWHHQSPYDLAISTNTSVDPSETPYGRARRASMTAAQSKHKAVIPSPLSQSTSAVHLQVPDTQGARIPRKLSKRQTPAVNHIFGNGSADLTGKVVSAPVSPIDNGHYDPDPIPLPKRMSVAPPLDNHSVAHSSAISSKKEKRGSVLGRLVKKFSILRKSGDGGKLDTEGNWHHVTTLSPASAHSDANSFPLGNRSHSPEKSNVDLTKRIPPPSVGEAEHSPLCEGGTGESDRVSLASVNPHISIGKLTIANPDAPEPGHSSLPDQPPIPPEKPVVSSQRNPKDKDDNMQPLTSEPLSPTTDSMLPPPDTNSPPPISLYLAPWVSIAHTPPVENQRPLPPEKPKVNATSAKPALSSYEYISSPCASSDETQRAHLSASGPSPAEDQGAPPSTLLPYMSRVASEHGSQQRGHSTHIFPSAPPPSEFLSPSPSGNFLPVPQRLSSLYTDSPLTTSSMLANPPTPYDTRLPIPSTPESVAPPPLPPKMERKRSSHDSSAADKTVGRQTETFKLIRSASGNVYASSETIVAAGQQWEVVESLEEKAKKRPVSSKSKGKEGSSRKESKEKADTPERTRRERDGETPERSRKEREGEVPERSRRDREDEVPERSRRVRETETPERSRREREVEIPERSRREREAEVPERRRRDREVEAPERSRREREAEAPERSRREREAEAPERSRREREAEAPERSRREREAEAPERSRREREHERSRREREAEAPERSRREREAEAPDRSRREREAEAQEKSRREREVEAPERARKEREVDEHHRRSRTHRSSKQPEEFSSPTKSRSSPRDEKHESSKREDRGTSNTEEKDNQTSRRSGARRRDDTESEHRQVRRRDDKEEENSSRRHTRKESDKDKRKDERDRENTNDRRKRAGSTPDNRKRDDTDNRKSVRRQDDGRDRGKESPAEHSSSHHNHTAPTQVPIAVPQTSTSPLERHPSTSTRPTSELPSAADMNALRAKEAWEMERLWKARSMYGMEPNGNSNNLIPPSGSSVTSDNVTSTGAMYGSSHTAFMVQGPFQGHAPYFYHSTQGPSPYMYSSASSVPSIHGSASSYDPSADKLDPWPPSSHNPLPEPPRESPYRPAILPPVQSSSGRSADHWIATYNGMTTAH